MSINEPYFAQLEDWKKLPAYKLETRIDSIVGFALPHILEHALGVHARTVIPELPLRQGTIFPEVEGNRLKQNRSNKLDFYVQTNSGQNLFIEFKSDSDSRSDVQDRYLAAARTVGMSAIAVGMLRLSNATKGRKYKRKYAYLVEKLSAAGLVEASAPSVANDTIRVVYIQPHMKDGDGEAEIIDFQQVSDAIKVSFPGDEFMQRFAVSLAGWSAD